MRQWLALPAALLLLGALEPRAAAGQTPPPPAARPGDIDQGASGGPARERAIEHIADASQARPHDDGTVARPVYPGMTVPTTPDGQPLLRTTNFGSR